MSDDRNTNRSRRAASAGQVGKYPSPRYKLLKATFENNLDAILLFDDDASYVDANPAACALTGYPRDELRQLSVWDLTPNMKRDEGLKIWRDLMRSGTLSGEYVLQRKDDTVIDVEFRAVASIVPGVHLCTLRDVSERKRQEEVLDLTNESLRTIIEASPAALIVLTLEGRITLWNPAAEEIFGWLEAEAVGQSYPLAGSQELVAEVREHVRRAAAGESITGLETQRQRKDGSLIAVSMNVAPVYDRSGEVTAVLGLITDITDRKEATRALEASEARYRHLFHLLPAGIFTKDRQGRYTSTNDRVLSYSARTPIGATDANLQPPEIAAQLRANDLQVMEQGERMVFEEKFIAPDGPRWLLSHKAPLRDARGNVTGILGTTQDITARKEAEQELAERAERLEMFQALHRAIIAIQPPEKTAETAIRFLSRLIDADRISAGLFAANHTTVQTLAAYSKGGTRLGQGAIFRLELYGSILEHLKQGETHKIDDLAALRESGPLLDRLRDEGLRTYLTIPLLSRDKLVGTLSIASSKPNAFSTRDEGIVREVADQVAIAIRQSQLLDEERRQRQLAEALQEASRVLSGTLDVEALWDRLLELIGEVVPYDAANVMAVEEERVRMTRLRGYREVGGEAMAERVAALTLPIEETANLREMMETGQAVIVPDTAADPDWITFPGIALARSWAGAPIQIRGVTVAFFSVEKAEPDFYGPEHAHVLEAFAGQVSLALQNAYLFTEMRQRLAELSALYEAGTSLTQLTAPDEVSRRILATLKSFMAYRQAGVIVRGEQGALQLLAYEGHQVEGKRVTEWEWSEELNRALGAGKSVVHWVIEHGEPVRLGDVLQDPRYVAVDPEVRSELCVPLRIADRTIGAINVEKREKEGFDAYDERLLVTIAAQAVVALENARLFAAEQRSREQLSRLAEYLQEAREAERTRIAREIHDEFGQTLTALNMDVAWLSQRLQPAQQGVAEKVQEMEELIVDSIRAMRRIATELRPGVLDDLGLVAALEWQTEGFARRYDIACQLQVDQEAVAVAGSVATACFRICQEALTNVARHAEASRVTVRLEKRSDEIVLTVRDNGRGIGDEEIHNDQSLGLTGMAERARSLGGRVVISGEQDGGTTITAHIPLSEKGESRT